jgi:hypothetical protein
MMAGRRKLITGFEPRKRLGRANFVRADGKRNTIRVIKLRVERGRTCSMQGAMHTLSEHLEKVPRPWRTNRVLLQQM